MKGFCGSFPICFQGQEKFWLFPHQYNFGKKLHIEQRYIHDYFSVLDIDITRIEVLVLNHSRKFKIISCLNLLNY